MVQSDVCVCHNWLKMVCYLESSSPNNSEITENTEVYTDYLMRPQEQTSYGVYLARELGKFHSNVIYLL